MTILLSQTINSEYQFVIRNWQLHPRLTIHGIYSVHILCLLSFEPITLSSFSCLLLPVTPDSHELFISDGVVFLLPGEEERRDLPV